MGVKSIPPELFHTAFELGFEFKMGATGGIYPSFVHIFELTGAHFGPMRRKSVSNESINTSIIWLVSNSRR